MERKEQLLGDGPVNHLDTWRLAGCRHDSILPGRLSRTGGALHFCARNRMRGQKWVAAEPALST